MKKYCQLPASVIKEIVHIPRDQRGDPSENHVRLVFKIHLHPSELVIGFRPQRQLQRKTILVLDGAMENKPIVPIVFNRLIDHRTALFQGQMTEL